MNIVVDNREAELSAAFSKLGLPNTITVSVNVLHIGDIKIDIGDKPLILFERKTYADLIASIRDGRYSEQGHRLQYSGIYRPHNIIYLIEGNFSSVKSPADRKTILSAITSLHQIKGFSVMRTASVVESAELIVSMAEKMHRIILDGVVFAHVNPNDEVQKEGAESPPYCAVVKQNKKENITSANIGSIMLCQVPGISATIAMAIMSHPTVNGSIPVLCGLLAQSDMGNLAAVTVQVKGNKSRKIGEVVIRRLAQLLLEEEKEASEPIIITPITNKPIKQTKTKTKPTKDQTRILAAPECLI